MSSYIQTQLLRSLMQLEYTDTYYVDYDTVDFEVN